ncbi:hypothetical protein PIB30_076647 [Stylosanthes scabra]|uniref:Uncharacterized protein n=1 Tax=Stylosanthes scabra TaxID=79078 RepID=A0ABU6VNT3_9FABA|nr:hypothetical protein [Stylosanthes scabra]
MSSHPLTTTMINHHQTANINNNPKGGATINKNVGTLTNNLNIANPTTTIHHKIPKILDTNLHILTDLLTKLTNQVLPSTSTLPPPNPSPLPSQPLPNPKGGINVVKKGDEEKEGRRSRTEWLLELMAGVDGLVDPDDEDW